MIIDHGEHDDHEDGEDADTMNMTGRAQTPFKCLIILQKITAPKFFVEDIIQCHSENNREVASETPLQT